MKTMATSFKGSHAGAAARSAPTLQQATPPPGTPGHSRAVLGQSPVGSLLLSPGSWCIRFCLCPPRVYFPVLCKFWQLYGEVNGDLLQDGLCHSQVCCTQSPCPCGRPPPTHPSPGDAQTQSVSVSVGSLHAGAHKVGLSPLSVSGSNGV